MIQGKISTNIDYFAYFKNLLELDTPNFGVVSGGSISSASSFSLYPPNWKHL